MHDLLREHARALAADDNTWAATAMDRLLAYYLHTARNADRYLARRARVTSGGHAAHFDGSICILG